MSIVKICNRVIEFSFYALFFLVPLAFWKETSELYELNKMWLTFFLALLIAASWTVKTIVLKKFYLQRTPLDIPIAIFLGSQVVSTVFSWDPYVSFWGYYSRFNGGLLTTLCYIFLYYAFLSNFDIRTQAISIVKRILLISLVSGTIVALWGLPSHFGYDPTCLLFRGSLDVSCWTSDFQPKIRIFATLGQPAWLGAYLTILIPLLIALILNEKRRLYMVGLSLLALLFYVDILFTKSRAALLGFWIPIASFIVYYFNFYVKPRTRSFGYSKIRPYFDSLATVFLGFLILTVIILNPIELNKGKVQKAKVQTPAGSFSTGGGGTESGKIRLYVWQGALNAWAHNPIIGTGVETFAFAYYKYKPIGHNLTSEWNYLYNKAHNEYLNFLTTSGLFGLGSYLFMIGTFLFIIFKYLKSNIYHRKSSIIDNKYLLPALVASYLSILITNFFGFSVVIVNIYFFLIPAFVYVLTGILNTKKNFSLSFEKKHKIEHETELSLLQKLDIFVVLLITVYLLLFLRNFWLADQAYALGSNLVRAGEYSSSYSSLKEAVDRVGFEPTYKDELASNDAIFSVALLSNLPEDEKDQKTTVTFAESLAKEAISYIDEITKKHPNNVVFLKTKVRIYYTLSQIDPKYTKDALSAIKKAQALAPKDANIFYNLGLLYGQNGETQKAIETLKQAIKIKPNYINAYYALGLFYRQMATDKNGRVIDPDLNKKAIEQMQYILKYLDPTNTEAKEALEAFEK